jgi:uncharacterized protein
MEGREGRCNRRRSMTNQLRRQRSRSAQRAMTLDQLNAWLNTIEPEPRVDGVSMLDGYLTAIVIGPCSIPPDEWFVDLLGERGRIATASGTALAAITLIVARFNAISQGLSIARKQHAPIFERMDNGTVLPEPWCMGFLTAMRLRMDAWQPLLDLNRIDHGLLLPILLHCTDPFGRPMLGPPREGRQTEELLRNAYHDIPPVIAAIREFCMPQRVHNAERHH